MQWRKRTSGIICLCFGLPLVTSSSFAAPPDSLSDNQLLQRVMPPNWRFYQLMGPCKNLHVQRVDYAGHPSFSIRGECPIKNLADGDSECPSYLLTADGTENPPTATIRKMTLALKCEGQ
jgi:hypothetical protein